MPSSHGVSFQPMQRRSSATVSREGIIRHSTRSQEKAQQRMRVTRTHDSVDSASSRAFVSLGPYAYIVRQPTATRLRDVKPQNRSRSKPPEPMQKEPFVVRRMHHTRDRYLVSGENDSDKEEEDAILWISPVRLQRNGERALPAPLFSPPQPLDQPSTHLRAPFVDVDTPVVDPNLRPHVCETGATPSPLDARGPSCVGTNSVLPTSFLSDLLNRMQEDMPESHERIAREGIGTRAPGPSDDRENVETIYQDCEYDMGLSSKVGTGSSRRQCRSANMYADIGEAHDDSTPPRRTDCHEQHKGLGYIGINTEDGDEDHIVRSNVANGNGNYSPVTREMGSLHSVETNGWAGRLRDEITADETHVSRCLAVRGQCSDDEILSLRVLVDYLKRKSERLEKELEELFWSNRYEGGEPQRVTAAYQGTASPQQYDGHRGLPHASYHSAHSHAFPSTDGFTYAQRGYSQHLRSQGVADALQGTPVRDGCSYQSTSHSQQTQQQGQSYHGGSRVHFAGDNKEASMTDRGEPLQESLSGPCLKKTSQRKSIVRDVSQFYTGRSLAADSRAKEKNFSTKKKKIQHHNLDNDRRTGHTSFSSSSSNSSSSASSSSTTLSARVSLRPQALSNSGELKFSVKNASLSNSKHHHRNPYAHSPMALTPRVKHPGRGKEHQLGQEIDQAYTSLNGKHINASPDALPPPPTSQIPPPGALIHPIRVPDMSDVASDAEVQRLRRYCTYLEAERERLVRRCEESRTFLSHTLRVDGTMHRPHEAVSLTSISSPTSSEKAIVRSVSLEKEREEQKASCTPPPLHAPASSASPFVPVFRTVSPPLARHTMHSPKPLTPSLLSPRAFSSPRGISPVPTGVPAVMHRAVKAESATLPRERSTLASVDHSTDARDHSPHAAASTSERVTSACPTYAFEAKGEVGSMNHTFNRDRQSPPKPHAHEDWYISGRHGKDAQKELRPTNTSVSPVRGAVSRCSSPRVFEAREVTEPSREPVLKHKNAFPYDRGQFSKMKTLDCGTPNECVSSWRSTNSVSKFGGASYLPNSTQDPPRSPTEKKVSVSPSRSPQSPSHLGTVTWSSSSRECTPTYPLPGHTSLLQHPHPNRKEEQYSLRAAKRLGVNVLDRSVHSTTVTSKRSLDRDENTEMDFIRNAATYIGSNGWQCSEQRDGIVVVNGGRSVRRTPESKANRFALRVITPVNTNGKSSGHGGDRVHREEFGRTRRFGLR